MTARAKKPRKSGASIQSPVSYTTVSITKEVVDIMSQELTFEYPSHYPAFLLGHYLSSTVIVTHTLGIRDMVMGTYTSIPNGLRHYMKGWRYGLAAGLRRQNQLTYLGAWLHTPGLDSIDSPSADERATLMDDPWFGLPDVIPPDPFCIIQSVSSQGHLKYRAELIDHASRSATEVRVNLI